MGPSLGRAKARRVGRPQIRGLLLLRRGRARALPRRLRQSLSERGALAQPAEQDAQGGRKAAEKSRRRERKSEREKVAGSFMSGRARGAGTSKNGGQAPNPSAGRPAERRRQSSSAPSDSMTFSSSISIAPPSTRTENAFTPRTGGHGQAGRRSASQTGHRERGTRWRRRRSAPPWSGCA
jgi:hypothetical protein